MAKLIAAKELIKKARAAGVDLGKGDPYNRLRYYTKIGWLPHMVRKSTKSGGVEGHFPLWAFTRLELIDELKSKNLSNDEITEQLKTADIKVSLKSSFSGLLSSENRVLLILYISFFLLMVILLFEAGVVSPAARQTSTANDLSTVPNQILASGNALIPANEDTIFVYSSAVTATSNINVTFSADYTPATRYWVDEKILREGFTVRLDSPTARTANFSWWISN